MQRKLKLSKENKMKIGNIIIKGKASLAPMAGITDRAFREICSLFGASYFTSEMISAKGLIYKSSKTYSLINHSEKEKPFAVQLFGNCPEDFFKGIGLLEKYMDKIDLIDINMGCPAKKIIKENSGSALMKNPKLCGEIVKAAKGISPVPVTVKIRAGWDEKHKNAAEIAQICELNGADAITVHGRTKEQGYSGTSDLEIIKKVKENVKIPVIGNGDVTSFETAEKMIAFTKCDMIAVGRGAMGNPWIFKEINEGRKITPVISEKVRIMKMHIQKLCEYKGEEVGIKESRKHIAQYIKNIHKASEFRKKAFLTKSKEELIDLCTTLQKI